MLYKPGKGKSKPGPSGKQKKLQHQQQEDQHHHHRWLRLGNLLSSLSHLSLFGSQHSVASNSSSAGEQAKSPEFDEKRNSIRRQIRPDRSQRNPNNWALSCQNLAQTENYEDGWMTGAQLTRNHANAVADQTDLRRGADRVAKWATGLDHLLADTDGVWLFADFLRTEFSEENVQFWLAVEQFKRLDVEQTGELLAAARRIERAYIGCDAPLCVNLDGATERELHRRLNCGQLDLGVFNAAQSQIFNLMRLDSYARFLKSPLYKDCMLCELESRPLPTPTVDRHRQSNDSILTMFPTMRSQQSSLHVCGSPAQKLNVIQSAELDNTSNTKRIGQQQLHVADSNHDSASTGTYRSRQPSFIVAALDLDCGYSVC